MYIKIINPATNGKNAYSNRGSARQATNYLEGEARNQGETAVFFNSDRADISGNEAVEIIDSNRKGLRKDDAKFYSLVISPSAQELEHIGHDPQKLQTFTARVMQEYAANFVTKSGQPLGEKDLVWVATQHDERKHRGHDGASSGQLKEGPQTHIHLMVSARNKQQKVTLNPLGSASRFNRVAFMAKGNVAFVEEFGPLKQAERPGQSRGADRAGAATEPGKYSRRRTLTAEEMADSIRRRAAANEGRAHRGAGTYKAKTSPDAADAVRDKQLFNQVNKLNKQLPQDRQISHNKVLEAARAQDYSKQFYGRLGQLSREAGQQKYHDHPYEFLRTGKDPKSAAAAIAESQKKDKRLFEQVDRINLKLPDDKKLNHSLVLQIAREQDYSKAFYGRLGRIGREAKGPKAVQEPYQFLRTGRVAKPQSELNPSLPTAPTKSSSQDPSSRATTSPLPPYQRTVTRTKRSQQQITTKKAAGIGQDLGRALGTEGYTQDIRGDEERD